MRWRYDACMVTCDLKETELCSLQTGQYWFEEVENIKFEVRFVNMYYLAWRKHRMLVCCNELLDLAPLGNSCLLMQFHDHLQVQLM